MPEERVLIFASRAFLIRDCCADAPDGSGTYLDAKNCDLRACESHSWDGVRCTVYGAGDL